MVHPLKNPHSLLPIIRKVIRKGDAFLCSICRTEYATNGEANGCLNQCWYEIRNFYPVVERRGLHRKLIYRCQYCCRDYNFETEALSCAQRCATDRNKLHIQEQLANDLPVEVPKKRPGIRINATAGGLGPRLRKQVENEVLTEGYKDPHDIEIEHFDDEPSTDRPAAAPKPTAESPKPVQAKAPVAPTPEKASKAPAEPAPKANKEPAPVKAQAAPEKPAEPAKSSAPKPAEDDSDKGRHKNSFTKQWSRQDAKYQCRYCNKRYYTKTEVEDCFNGHFNEDGYEKEIGAGPEN